MKSIATIFGLLSISIASTVNAVGVEQAVQEIFSKADFPANYNVVEMYLGDEINFGGKKISCYHGGAGSIWPGGDLTVDQNGSKIEKNSNYAAASFYCMKSVKEPTMSKIKRKYAEYKSKKSGVKIHYLYSGEMVSLGTSSISCTLDGSRIYTNGLLVGIGNSTEHYLGENGETPKSEQEAKHIVHCKQKSYFLDSDGNEDPSVKNFRQLDQIRPVVANKKVRFMCMSIRYYPNVENQDVNRRMDGARISLVAQDFADGNRNEVYSLPYTLDNTKDEPKVIHDLCVAADDLGYCKCLEKGR